MLTCLFVSPLSDFLILPGFIDFTSDEVVSVITLLICLCVGDAQRTISLRKTRTITFVFLPLDCHSFCVRPQYKKVFADIFLTIV